MKLVKTFSAMMLLLVCGLSCSADTYGQVEERSIAANEIQVSGDLVDIRIVKKGAEVFPQNSGYVFDEYMVGILGNRMDYAVGLMEYPGPLKVRRGEAAGILIACDTDDLETQGWSYKGRKFQLGTITYYIHGHEGELPGEWVELPPKSRRNYSPMVFGNCISVTGTKVYGTEITRVRTLRKGMITNVCIAVLPDGNYIAACTGSRENYTTTMFVSEDKGRTWRKRGDFDASLNKVATYYNLFVHNGILYIMGVGPDRENIYICKSEDKGETWTVPEDEDSGLLFKGLFHSAPVPVLVADGRVWRAFETYGDGKRPFVISAPQDSDLLKAENWTMTNILENTSYNIGDVRISGLIEGNMVAGPDGQIYNILRSNSSQTSRYAAKARLRDINTIEYDHTEDWIVLPGGGKKFTIRYDVESGLWWTLTNPDYEGTASHNGIYSGGMSHSLMRNRLVLCYSTDLENWVESKDIFYDKDPFFHGFQYCDWCFDGDDIAAVVRMACPESRGLPVRQHDANIFSFVRIEDFRNCIN